jgi:ribosomal-protein-alanine N-acetyltransferase
MTTERIFRELDAVEYKLVRLTDERAPEMFLLRSNEKAMQYIERARPSSIDDIYELIKTLEEDFVENRSIIWAIIYTPTNELAGTIGYYRMQPQHFRAELGYMLFPNFWGKGVMSKCIKVVIDFGFNDMQLHSIEADINPANEGSRKILQKFGFRSEAYFRENFYFNGVFMDTEVFSLLKSEYYKK